MHHIRRHLAILGEAKKILQDYGMFPDDTDPGYKAALIIYRTSFEQLVRSGLDVEYKNGQAVLSTDGETFAIRISPSSAGGLNLETVRAAVRREENGTDAFRGYSDFSEILPGSAGEQNENETVRKGKAAVSGD